MVYWNADGKAAYAPQDLELFTIEAVSKADSTVKIRNTVYADHAILSRLHPNTFPCYVGLVGNSFNRSQTVQNAGVFVVQFP